MNNNTKELYGVNTKELAEMPYKDALKIIHIWLWGKKKLLAEELFRATSGDEASAIQTVFKEVLEDINNIEAYIRELK